MNPAHKTYVFFTDIDGTIATPVQDGEDLSLRPIDPDLEALNAFLAQPDAHVSFSNVLVTGRPIELVLQDRTLEHHLGLCDYVITNVGTAIYTRDANGVWTASADYTAHIRGLSEKPFDPALVRQALADFGFTEQPAHLNSDLKLSYTLSPDANKAEVEPQVRQALTDAGLEAEIIWSLDAHGTHVNLDFLAKGANKAGAIDFVYKQIKQTLPLDTKIVLVGAGDTGNDEQAAKWLAEQAEQGEQAYFILPSNAQKSFKEKVQDLQVPTNPNFSVCEPPVERAAAVLYALQQITNGL
jgi:hydroxymethylpyrimidine pyrophosphatase-like HAD family hydrolase